MSGYIVTRSSSSSSPISSSLSSMATDSSPPRFRVGYALINKKQYSFIQPSLLSLAASRGVDLVPVDPSLPLADQGPFDLIIHKLYSDTWKDNLRRFSALHPAVPVVDPPDAIERLHNRISMLQVVSELQIDNQTTAETFGIPPQVVVYDAAALADSRAAVAGLHFPVIAKPLVADGSAKSHKMALVFHPEGLVKLKPPLVLQEFVNHGGVIFKVYVVGDYVKCVKRKSLPDVSNENFESLERSLSFSQISNMPSQNKAEEGYYEATQLEDAEMPPAEFLTAIARGLRQAIGLNLFNFDVIRDVNVGNHYFIIDINYFPGYAKMPSYETVFTDFFLDILHKEEENDDRSRLAGGKGKLTSSDRDVGLELSSN